MFRQVQGWGEKNLVGIFIFNILLMFLILLHSAGYFKPYFPITINMIVFISLMMAILFFKARSRVVFGFGLFFWTFAGLLKLLSVDIWAERTAVYAYEALILGLAIFIIEKYERKT